MRHLSKQYNLTTEAQRHRGQPVVPAISTLRPVLKDIIHGDLFAALICLTKRASVPLCLCGCISFCFFVIGLVDSTAQGQIATVSAAISLKDAMTVAADQYQKQTGEAVRLNYGASGDLANQIVAEAPVDLFISAGKAQIKQLQDAKLVDGIPSVLVRNELVLIAPSDQVDLQSWKDLANAKRIAIGDPKSVPAGQYAAEVFQHLGLAEQLKDKFVYGANVRQVLAYVERGEVDAGVVYATDATQAGAKVRVVAIAPQGSHEPIEYPAVLLRGGDSKAAQNFLKFLTSDPGQQIFIRFGFAKGTP
jgi:molybdate transport system substrate-binding protein